MVDEDPIPWPKVRDPSPYLDHLTGWLVTKD
jgi:hypothetical protein